MKELRYTLVSDGSSDAALLPIITWLLRENGVGIAIQPVWADLRLLRRPVKRLWEKIQIARELYPCDLLFIHRDSETQPREQRIDEIHDAATRCGLRAGQAPFICVVPIRMTEAWLLFSEGAIRHAAGNRSGQQQLALPPLTRVEALPDPKQLLYQSLEIASGLSGRRLKQFRPNQHAGRVAELIDDFSPLRTLAAFTALEADICAFFQQNL